MRAGLLATCLGGLVLLLAAVLTPLRDAPDLAVIQENALLPAGPLDATHRIGQTFSPRSPHLSAIQVRWIVSPDFRSSQQGQLTLHLRRRPDDPDDLAVASIPTSSVRHNEYGTFAFAPVADLPPSFYFCLDATSAGIERGWLSVWTGWEDDYAEGEMDVNGRGTGRDLTFRALVRPDAGTLADELVRRLSALGVAPGILAALVILTGGLLLGWLRRYATERRIGAGARAGQGEWAILRAGWDPAAWVVLIGLAFLALGVVVLQVRDIPVPLWVDSFTHARYIQTIMDHAQTPAGGFYHYGFHIVTALVARVARLSIPEAMLIVGQWCILQVGLGLFLLSRRLSGSTMAGLAAAGLVWFLSPTPSYFVTWGRYPLLMGCALLPLALWSAVRLIDARRAAPRLVALALVTLALLGLTHIRLIALYLAFTAVYAASAAWRERLAERARPDAPAAAPSLRTRSAIWLIALLGASAFLLGELWTHGASAESMLALNAAAPSVDWATAVAIVGSHHGALVALLALAGVGLGLWRRSRVAWISVGWYIVLWGISAVPGPAGGEWLSPSLVLLLGFLPAALLAGQVAAAAEPHRPIGLAVIVLLALIGARDMAFIVNPATVLFSSADAAAMEFIRDRVPAGSRWLVNSTPWFESTFVPADGGGWIPYLTRDSIGYLDAVPERDESVAQWVVDHRPEYIYLGRRAGVLSASDFAGDPEQYGLIYDREGIRIFRVQEPAPAIAAEQK